jgi:hypothetical protein
MPNFSFSPSQAVLDKMTNVQLVRRLISAACWWGETGDDNELRGLEKELLNRLNKNKEE